MEKTKVVRVGPEIYPAFKCMISEEQEGGWLFQDRMVMYGAVFGDNACGTAIVGVNDNDAELIWLYTVPSFRNKGVATKLIEFIMDDMAKQSKARIYGIYAHKNEQQLWLDKLFVNCSFSLETERHRNYHISFEEFLRTPMVAHFLANKKKLTANIFPLKNIPKYYTRALLLKCNEKKIYLTDRLDLDEYDQKYSVACLAGNEITGVLLARRQEDNCLNLENLFTFNANMDVVRQMVRTSALSLVDDIVSGKEKNGSVKVQVMKSSMNDIVHRLLLVEPYDEPWFHKVIYEI